MTGACVLAGAGCARDPGEERLEVQGAPPAAAMLAPGQESESLHAQLERLRVELAAGLDGDPERLLQAEAITDGLMEARRPFDWLGVGYDLEARLRQLQAMADRVVARLRRDASIAEVEEDVETMIAAATDLRRQLAAAAGGPAPPSLDSLLAQDPLEGARVGARAVGAAAPVAAEDTAQGQAEGQPQAAPPTPPRRAGPLGRPVGAPPDTTGPLP